jgi:hypothetical protein
MLGRIIQRGPFKNEIGQTQKEGKFMPGIFTKKLKRALRKFSSLFRI